MMPVPISAPPRRRTARPRWIALPFPPRWLAFVLLATLLVGPTASADAVAQTGPATPTGDTGVRIVHGLAGSSVGLGGTAPPFAALTDLTAYLDQDLTVPLDPRGQILAPLRSVATQAQFDLALPEQPLGQPHAFGDAPEPGVQIFAVNIHASLGESPFLDPFEYSGWPTAYSTLSLATGTFAIDGGALLVWSDGDHQTFPTGPGPDGRLFTGDDPLAPVAAGWTLIDLSTPTFRQHRDATADVTIIPGFGGVRDLSRMNDIDAFDTLVAQLRVAYPFTDQKHIDWDALNTIYRPEIAAAQRAGDRTALNDALLRFAAAIPDGHVGVTPGLPALRERLGGTLGFTIGASSYGAVFVTTVAPDSPAAAVGITPGLELVSMDGVPATAAVDATDLIRPVSTAAARRDEQLRLLPLGPVGTQATLAVRVAPDQPERTVTLPRTASDEPVLALLGQDRASLAGAATPPVDSRLLDDQTGYVRVRTFAEAPQAITAGWDYAIGHLQRAGATNLILDLRGNPGGILPVATYLAGSFITQPVNLADLHIRADDGSWPVSGKLIVRPNQALWSGRVTVLIDSGCISACEVLAGALAANPATEILGSEPTGGVVGTVSFWQLPSGLTFQAPLGRYLQGERIWLEGRGVSPTIVVPVSRTTLLSGDDAVLDAAVRAQRLP